MRKFKTAEKNRTNYIYYTDKGEKIVIHPGDDGVTEELITLLHDWDDKDVDAERKEEYHIPIHYQAFKDGKGKDADDRNPYLADVEADFERRMLEAIREQERAERLERLGPALETLTDIQKATLYKKFYLNKSNVAIAKEEGVTEAAIRKRLRGIYANLSKKI